MFGCKADPPLTKHDEAARSSLAVGASPSSLWIAPSECTVGREVDGAVHLEHDLVAVRPDERSISLRSGSSRRRGTAGLRHSELTDRNPACFAGHDDFDRLPVSIRALAADAGSAGIGGEIFLLERVEKGFSIPAPERGRAFLDMSLDLANDPMCRGGSR